MHTYLALAVLLLLPLHAPAALRPEMAARLASLRNEGEGQRVTEALLRAGDHPGGEVQRRIRRIAEAAIPFIDSSVRAAPWNDVHMGLDGPACFDAAPKLGLLLRALEQPGWVASCGHHVFLIAQTAEATLLIDPTIRQYFGQSSAPEWVPTIFVGTLSELKALYERDPGLPVLPYQQIYFNADWPATRKDSAMLSARDKLLRAPDGREFSPLTRFLNQDSRCEQFLPTWQGWNAQNARAQ